MKTPTDNANFQTDTAQIDEKHVKLLSGQGTDTGTLAAEGHSLTYPDFTYRHDWGNRKGSLKLTLTSSRIHWNSNVFVSISEHDGIQTVSQNGDPVYRGPTPMMGGARYTVHNVAPRGGAVEIWVHIDWKDPFHCKFPTW